MKDYDIAAIILPDDNAKDLITQVYGEGVIPSPTLQIEIPRRSSLPTILRKN